VKSAKGENTKAVKSGKGVNSVKSPPCPDDGILVDDDNIKTILKENSSDKEALKCYDTSQVTYMYDLFKDILDFNADLSSWDVSSVIDMSAMFRFATEFNGDVSDWDVSGVKSFVEMFDGASEFNQQMCGWTLEGKKYKKMFDDSLCTLETCIECTE